MYERHFVQRKFSVRIGGWRLGRLRIGGGRYVVRPFTVGDVFAIQEALARLKVPAGMTTVEAAQVNPFGVLRPFVRFAVDGTIKRRHLARLDREQFQVIINAVKAANDVPYLMKLLVPTEETVDEKADAVTFIVAVVAALHGARNEQEVIAMPFQRAVAILDATGNGDGGGMGIEKATELEAQNLACGFVVN